MEKEVECGGIRLLTTPAAAMILGIRPGTLYNWRADNKGPKYFKAGGKVLYDKKDLHKWIEDKKVDPENRL